MFRRPYQCIIEWLAEIAAHLHLLVSAPALAFEDFFWFFIPIAMLGLELQCHKTRLVMSDLFILAMPPGSQSSVHTAP